MMQKFLDAISEDKEYNFIANNYYQMSKQELKDILLEYICAVHDVGEPVSTNISEAVAEELESREIFG